MAKLTTTDISSILANPTGAATAINNNNALIESALENTLSRDGTSPNEMEANLDMNTNRILNLPSPMYVTEPIRVQDLPELTGGDIIFNGMDASIYDPGGIEADVFDMDNMVQGTTNRFLTPSMYATFTDISKNIKDFGAVGDGTTDDSDAFADATAWLRSISSGLKPMLILGDGDSFKITETWDLTQLRINGLNIEFNNSIILGYTVGKPVIDMLDSEHIHLRNGSILGGSTDTPNYGIQLGRGIVAPGLPGRGAAYCSMVNIQFFGEYTEACVINSASELFYAERCNFWNASAESGASAYIADGMRAIHIESDFFTVTQPNDTINSHNGQEFVGCTFENIGGTGTGYAIKSYGNAFGHKYKNCYAQNELGAMLYLKGTHFDCVFDIHAEATQLVNYVVIDAPDATTTRLSRCSFNEYYLFSTAEFMKGTGGTGTINFENCEINIDDTLNDVASVDSNGTTLNFHGTIKLGSSNNGGTYDLSGFATLYANIHCALATSLLVLPTASQVYTLSLVDGVGSVGSMTVQTSTTAALSAIGNVINTTNKRAGKLVLDTTTSKLMVALGSNANSGWTVADNGSTITPS